LSPIVLRHSAFNQAVSSITFHFERSAGLGFNPGLLTMVDMKFTYVRYRLLSVYWAVFRLIEV
jgi:hypothetical protein